MDPGTKVQSITIIGRRWHQRGKGHYYCTVEIIVNGHLVHKTEKQRGFDDHYISIGRDWLAAKGYISKENESLQLLCDRSGISLVCSVADVGRERDL